MSASGPADPFVIKLITLRRYPVANASIGGAVVDIDERLLSKIPMRLVRCLLTSSERMR
jgi:hypothetical protein